MRIDLKEENMDIVMHVVRKDGIRIVDIIDYLLDNPEIIELTRGELNGKRNKGCKNTCKKY